MHNVHPILAAALAPFTRHVPENDEHLAALHARPCRECGGETGSKALEFCEGCERALRCLEAFHREALSAKVKP